MYTASAMVSAHITPRLRPGPPFVLMIEQGCEGGNGETKSSSVLANEGSDMNILIAEDEFLITLTLKSQLEAMGHRVIGMPRDGDAAVTATRDLRPDVVLMDIGMPGLDGISATAKIMAETPTPVIMLTAYNDRQRVQDAIRAGATAYLLKPVNESQLKRAIDDIAGGSKKIRAHKPAK